MVSLDKRISIIILLSPLSKSAQFEPLNPSINNIIHSREVRCLVNRKGEMKPLTKRGLLELASFIYDRYEILGRPQQSKPSESILEGKGYEEYDY